MATLGNTKASNAMLKNNDAMTIAACNKIMISGFRPPPHLRSEKKSTQLDHNNEANAISMVNSKVPMRSPPQNLSVGFHFWMGLYIAANATAFTLQAKRYAQKEDIHNLLGMSMIISRSAAQCLNLNCALILLPVSSSLVTRFQVGTPPWARRLFSLDGNMTKMHKWLGLAILSWTVVHVGAHMCNLHKLSMVDPDSIQAVMGDKLFGPIIPKRPGQRWNAMLFRSRAGVTGIIMLLCMAISYPLIIYRRRQFSSFWISHHLLVVLLIALCSHGTENVMGDHQSVYWISVPLVIYLLARFFRELPSRSRGKVIDAHVKEGDNVLRLRLEKPPSWNASLHQPGMYANLQIPNIIQHEWHPFTITSIPNDPFLEFHIKKAGDWTAQMHHTVETLSVGDAGASNRDVFRDLIVKVDGPLAASPPLQDVPIIMLVGAGIGVTPSMSLLQRLLSTCPKVPASTATKQVYLYWTLRNRQSFEWFSESLQDVCNTDKGRSLLRARYFLTQVRTNVISNKRLLQHEVYSGRPHWPTELKRVKKEAMLLGQNKCAVFVCGPESMTSALEAEIETTNTEDGNNFQFYVTTESFH